MNRNSLVVFLLLLVACQAPRLDERPLIGITTSFQVAVEGRQAQLRLNPRYVEAVLEGGGIPLVLPVLEDQEAIERYVALLDGLVLIGGADIPPSAYGQEPHPTVQVLPDERYQFERALIERWLGGEKPLLGICLGLQFTNVVKGGTLIQDIPDLVGTEVLHRADGRPVHHAVEILAGTRLAAILGAGRQEVFSSHHQAADRVAPGLRVAAKADDGVIEALEGVGRRWCVLVQWHPEQMAGSEHRRALFQAFVEACRR